MNNDWRSAVWYYKKILEEKHPSFVPLLAFAQWKAGDSSSARETLEFNKTSRHTLVVRALIAIGEKDEENAVRTAQQCAGAVIPAEWVGVNLELEKLRKLKKPSSAVKVLLKSIKTIGRENRANNAQ